MILANIISDIIYQLLNLTFPGPPLVFMDWQQFVQSMLLASMVAGAVGWAAFAFAARVQIITVPPKLKLPYIYGRIAAWILVILWAIIYIIKVGQQKATGFVNINAFLIILLSGLLAWAICALLVSWYCRLPIACRYRYVTLLGRLLQGGKKWNTQ